MTTTKSRFQPEARIGFSVRTNEELDAVKWRVAAKALGEVCVAEVSMCRLSALTVLVVGATGSVGRFVVEEALRHHRTVRALVRSRAKARMLPIRTTIFDGDVTRPSTLSSALEGVHAIVLTLGTDGLGRAGAEAVDYGGVRNILQLLGSSEVRIVLMTAVGVTNRASSYNGSTEAYDWRRRAERLVRASGSPYTIVRPGWFDCNRPDERRLVVRQGDTRHHDDRRDGVISRRQLAETLVHSLTSDTAIRKTFELSAARGHNSRSFEALFASLKPDPLHALDGVFDKPNMPLKEEPIRVREDLEAIQWKRLHRRLLASSSPAGLSTHKSLTPEFRNRQRAV